MPGTVLSDTVTKLLVVDRKLRLDVTSCKVGVMIYIYIAAYCCIVV